MHPGHSFVVGARRLRQSLQPASDRGHITGQIGEPAGTGIGHETLGQQSIQLIPDIGDSCLLQCLRLVGDGHLHLVKCCQHRGGPGRDRPDQRRQLLYHSLLRRHECRSCPYRFTDQCVDSCIRAVLQKGGQRPVGIGTERQPGAGVQPALDRLGW